MLISLVHRHAKEHHKDKRIDDPQLREILDRRIGPAQVRGRKKRSDAKGLASASAAAAVAAAAGEGSRGPITGTGCVT